MFVAFFFSADFVVCVLGVCVAGANQSRFFGFAAVRVRLPTVAFSPTRKRCSICGETFTGKAWVRFYSGLALSRDTSFDVFFVFCFLPTPFGMLDATTPRPPLLRSTFSGSTTRSRCALLTLLQGGGRYGHHRRAVGLADRRPYRAGLRWRRLDRLLTAFTRAAASKEMQSRSEGFGAFEDDPIMQIRRSFLSHACTITTATASNNATADGNKQRLNFNNIREQEQTTA